MPLAAYSLRAAFPSAADQASCARPAVLAPADDPKVARELQFFERVKQRLRNKEAYADFLKCLNMFAEDILAKQELVRWGPAAAGRMPERTCRPAEESWREQVGKSGGRQK